MQNPITPVTLKCNIGKNITRFAVATENAD